MRITSWATKNSAPGTARIHSPWLAVSTVNTAASGSTKSATRLRC
jgi:chitodextrinase